MKRSQIRPSIKFLLKIKTKLCTYLQAGLDIPIFTNHKQYEIRNNHPLDWEDHKIEMTHDSAC